MSSHGIPGTRQTEPAPGTPARTPPLPWTADALSLDLQPVHQPILSCSVDLDDLCLLLAGLRRDDLNGWSGVVQVVSGHDVCT
jgi:hypothetical protein